MPYYYFDWTYVVLVLPCVLLSLWASANVNSTFRKYSQQYSSRRLTGAEAAQRVLSANGVYGVRIERISGNLTDHYDPRTDVIRLSDSVYGNTSTAAIGVGPSRGRARGAVRRELTPPIKLRAAIIPVTNIGSKLAMPLILIGLSCCPTRRTFPISFVHLWHRPLWSFPGVPAGDPSRENSTPAAALLSPSTRAAC